MPVNPGDKPLDALREETIDRLIMNYGHGELSLEAFQRRLDEAYDAQHNHQLIALTADLDLAVDSAYVARKRETLDIQADPEPADDVEYMIHVFSGGDRKGRWTPARELRVVTVFGGCDIDFSEARFAAPVTTVKMVCLFGGVNVFVREDINVTSKALCMFGGINNKAANTGGSDAPRVIIEGFVLFGGANIKVRKTMKQRMLEFADSVRATFGPGAPSGAAPRQSR